ncbi:SOS response-associated peptidase [Limnoglobus roseus]|uniref:Abasic site processing protein n=1 Tax=Limnoglobus roseus TaxID=2598579 RepID=A0A5C1AAK1_9BACT|nr:SOS response-associated peptidase [Limnoglobus roseus]
MADLFRLATVPAALEPRYNVAPAQPVAVVSMNPGGATRGLAMLPWGPLPDWVNSSKDGRFPNARAETVATKPAFAGSFRAKRCLILCGGCYEWKPAGKRGGGDHCSKTGCAGELAPRSSLAIGFGIEAKVQRA